MLQMENITIVASRRGRLRIEVLRLYRSPAAKADIEQALAGHPGVIDTRANPVTARELILFRPELDACVLLAELGITVPPKPLKLSKPAAKKAGPAQRRAL